MILINLLIMFITIKKKYIEFGIIIKVIKLR